MSRRLIANLFVIFCSPEGGFSTEVTLNEGLFEYKFIVDGEWHHDPDKQYISNAFGSVNNIIQVLQTPSHLYYH